MKRFFYSETESTNQQARIVLSKYNAALPIWVSAGYQTRGRGHGSNSWHGSDGLNITGTLVFKPNDIPAERQFAVSQAISLGITDFLHLFIEKAQVKWPNDIYAGDSKICGILLEHDVRGEVIEHTIAGIGLNINQTEFPSTIPNPVSLKQITGFDYNMEELEPVLHSCLQNRIEQLRQSNLKDIRQEYLENLYRYKQFAPFKSGDVWFEGRITGLGPFGELLIEEKDGTQRSFEFKEVEFIL